MEIGIEIKIGKGLIGESWQELRELNDEITSLENVLDSINWEDMIYEVNVTLQQLNGTLVESADITFYGQQDQDTVVKTTDANGEVTFNLLPYSTPYDVLMEHSSILDEGSFGVLVYDDTDKVMNITLYMLEGANNLLDEINSLSNTLNDIVWEAV